MKWRMDGYNWLVRLERGERLIENLVKLVEQEGIKGAWVSGIGAAAWAEIGHYDLLAKQYNWKKIDKLLEITSLQGNISWERDRPLIHLHGTFSDTTMQAFGGHIKELEVAATCEILLHRWYDEKLTRSLDDDTGLKLLDL